MCSVPVGLGAKRTRLIGASCATATLDVARRAATVGTPCSPEEDVIPRRIRSRPVSATTGPRIADVVAARHEGGTEKARVAMGTGRHRRGLHRSARLRLLRLAERRACASIRTACRRCSSHASPAISSRSRSTTRPAGRSRSDLRADGTIRPSRPVPAGTRLEAEAIFRRPGWVGWIAGRTQRTRLELTAPTARLASRWLRVERGAPVQVDFDRPVREVQVTGVRPRKTIHLTRPARSVALGRFGDAGSVGVSAVALDWERLPPPTAVTWFPPGRTAMVLPSPDAGRELVANAPLRLRFSDPVREAARTQAAGARAGHPRPLAANRRAHARVSA